MTSSTSPSTPTIALIAAMPMELGALARKLELTAAGPFLVGRHHGATIVAAVGGVGAQRCTAALEQLIEQHEPTQIINIGIAGGLAPSPRAGDVIDFDRVMNETGQTIDLQTDAPSGQTLLTVHRAADTPAKKRQLHEQYGAAAVDMESFYLARLAADRGIPFRVIRAISDPAETPLPSTTGQWLRSDGSVNVGRAVRHLAAHPSMLPQMLRLRRDTRLAIASLTDHTCRLLTTWPANSPTRPATTPLPTED